MVAQQKETPLDRLVQAGKKAERGDISSAIHFVSDLCNAGKTREAAQGLNALTQVVDSTKLPSEGWGATYLLDDLHPIVGAVCATRWVLACEKDRRDPKGNQFGYAVGYAMERFFPGSQQRSVDEFKGLKDTVLNVLGRVGSPQLWRIATMKAQEAGEEKARFAMEWFFSHGALDGGDDSYAAVRTAANLAHELPGEDGVGLRKIFTGLLEAANKPALLGEAFFAAKEESELKAPLAVLWALSCDKKLGERSDRDLAVPVQAVVRRYDRLEPEDPLRQKFMDMMQRRRKDLPLLGAAADAASGKMKDFFLKSLVREAFSQISAPQQKAVAETLAPQVPQEKPSNKGPREAFFL